MALRRESRSETSRISISRHPNYPQDLLNKVGPRNVLHTFVTDKVDKTIAPLQVIVLRA